jgi:hypothetical protein
MTTILAAVDGSLLVAKSRGGAWEPELKLAETSPLCLVVDPSDEARVWCGTGRAGVWRSADAGNSWQRSGGPLPEVAVSGIALGPSVEGRGPSTVYAGTDPTALYRSDDGGESWRELSSLLALPSSATWSFPPKPTTSHVRWITIAPADADTVYVCIEAGALVRSRDRGETWIDRMPGGPWDTHTLAVHPMRPGRLYSAAGDGIASPGHGYQESMDGGEHWVYPDEGLQHHYLYGLAVDPGDPDTIVVSAASSPWTAHDPRSAQATVYRRTGGGPWREVREGLPPPEGTTRALLATHPAEPGVFYAVSNRGLYRSQDAGTSWARLPVEVPGSGSGDVRALAVAV